MSNQDHVESINPSGLCECGCGEETSISYKTRTCLGHIKGQPVRFILGHHLKKHMNGGHGKCWKGGRTKHVDGYIQVWQPEHNNSDSKGYVLEHVLIASDALDHPIPSGVIVHHHNGDPSDNRNENLIVCEDQAYHLLLHKRRRALEACGNPNWKRCKHCHHWDEPKNLYVSPDGWNSHHRSCHNEYQRKRRRGKLQ